MGISTGNSTDDTGPYSLFLLREEELRQAGVMAAHEGSSALVSTAAATAFVTPSAAIPDAPILTPITDAATMALGIPTDPDTMAPGQTQWHLVGTWGLHADRVWPDYTGQGILVGVMDDGFQYTHWDISANYRTDIDRDIANNDNDAAPVYAGDNHGTSVIGTIIADDNGMGGVGVAFDARAYGIRLDFGGGGTLQNTYDGFTYAFTSGADVMNNSWGYTTAFSDTTGVNFAGLDFIEIAAAIENLVDNGRGGLGTNIVFAAGNARVAAPGLAGGDNVNYHNMQNSPHTITVAAIDSDGTYSSFSTPGAALLVAAGGTTVYVPDRIGGAGYGGGDYTNFSGTSAAAPIVSGAIAVILDANPNLGWRDVQEILAYSTQHNDAASVGWQYNGASNWNGGGLHFSHDYGFGAVDLHRAVRLAETWIGTQTSANQTILAPVSASPAIAIPAIGTITHTINIAQDIEIEHVLIDLNISHARAGDLIVTLISPDGTESILIDRPVNGTFTGIYGFTGIDFLTTSNAHWGESSAGTWTLRIQDAAGGNAGTLNSWSLAFWGNAQSNDDVYIYTDDYGNFSGGALAARSTLTDTTGTDTINLAAVTSNTTLNMNGGMASTIAGDAMTIAGGTIIENAYLGDGNDTITGNSANNIIYGGRGNDNFFGSGGSDTLDGETGADTLTYLESIANFTFNFINATTLQIIHAVGAAWTDLVRNIESFVFNEGTYTRAQLEAYVPGGGGGPNVINGTAGNDTLSGTAANNTINGGAGADTLSGMAGDDTLNGGDGADRLYAGAGNDMLHGGNGNDNYYYTASGEAEGDVIEDNGGTGDTQDRVYFNGLSSAFNPILRLESGNNIDLMVTSDWGTVRIRNQFAADASDRIEGIFGTVTGQSAATGIALTTAQLTFMGLNTDEILTMPEYGLSASQQHRIYGMGGNDTITGGVNADYLYGGDGNDTVNGGLGNDYLYGDAGNDVINGDAGSDMIYGGLGADTISGGAGNDNYYYIAAGEAQGDIIEDNGGDATDRIYFSNLVLGTAPVYGISGVDLLVTTEWGTLTIRNQFAADASDRIEGIFTQRAGASTITGVTLSTMLFNFEGTSGSDTLTMPGFGISTSQSHRIYGRDGDDTIIGSTRGDYLYGDNGNDTLIGGGGADYLYGGSGADRFVFDALTAFPGQTRINDFSVAQGDIIDISDILTGYDPMSDLITDFIRITNSGGNSILAVDVNGGANSFVTLATIVGVTGLTDEQALVDSGNLVI